MADAPNTIGETITKYGEESYSYVPSNKPIA
mgnify:CR=1 FL=1|jgi:hypothetical protein